MKLHRQFVIVNIFCLVSFVCLFFPGSNNISQAIRTISSFLFIGYAPGLVWSYTFWPLHTIANIERVFISIVISLVAVPLFSFLANRVAIKISPSSTLSIAVSIVILGLLVWFKQKNDQKKVST